MANWSSDQKPPYHDAAISANPDPSERNAASAATYVRMIANRNGLGIHRSTLSAISSPNFWTGVRRGWSVGCAFVISGSEAFWWRA